MSTAEFSITALMDIIVNDFAGILNYIKIRDLEVVIPTMKQCISSRDISLIDKTVLFSAYFNRRHEIYDLGSHLVILHSEVVVDLADLLGDYRILWYSE